MLLLIQLYCLVYRHFQPNPWTHNTLSSLYYSTTRNHMTFTILKYNSEHLLLSPKFELQFKYGVLPTPPPTFIVEICRAFMWSSEMLNDGCLCAKFPSHVGHLHHLSITSCHLTAAHPRQSLCGFSCLGRDWHNCSTGKNTINYSSEPSTFLCEMARVRYL